MDSSKQQPLPETAARNNTKCIIAIDFRKFYALRKDINELRILLDRLNKNTASNEGGRL